MSAYDERKWYKEDFEEAFQYLASLLPDYFHCDLVGTGGGALVCFYGYDDCSTDFDAFELGRSGFSPELSQAIRKMEQERPDTKEWLNHEIIMINEPGTDSMYELEEHIEDNLGVDYYNASGACVITVYPVSIITVMKNKLAPYCYRDKDIPHLLHIADYLDLESEERMKEAIIGEYKYIEDELWWDEFDAHIKELYNG